MYITTRIIFLIFKGNHDVSSLKLSMVFQNFLNRMQAIEGFPCSALFISVVSFPLRCPHSHFVRVTPHCLLFPEHTLLIHTTGLLHMLSSVSDSLPQLLSSHILLVPTAHTPSLPGACTTLVLATAAGCHAGSPR